MRSATNTGRLTAQKMDNGNTEITMRINLIKKTQEGRRPLSVEKKSITYVPHFTNEKGLSDLVADIHAQYKDAQDGGEESGWDGDAKALELKDAMNSLDYPYLLAIGGSNTVFAFTSESDRDCVIIDYLPDPEAW